MNVDGLACIKLFEIARKHALSKLHFSARVERSRNVSTLIHNKVVNLFVKFCNCRQECKGNFNYILCPPVLSYSKPGPLGHCQEAIHKELNDNTAWLQFVKTVQYIKKRIFFK